MLKKLTFTSLFILLASCSLNTSQKKPNVLLSESLTHWHNVYADGEAKIVDNEIHLISHGNWFFLTKEQYSDFVLEAEILMPDVEEYSNSGFIFRAQTRPHKSGKGLEAYGYQAEVDPSDRKWSGGLYDQGRRKWLHPIHPERSHPDSDFKLNKSPTWTDEKANAYKHLQWNKYRIEAIGTEIKIFVNGVLTTHVIDLKESKGHIGIQHHGSKLYSKSGDRSGAIRFRNIQLTSI
ncbi:secreted glycosyl hydrolase [Catenovulum agarivorans DS-2]|uniref:Secreted glycosyl hydrolase n=1 Tax=Catenovulum agarivorans DS-2 TaxID=1328313 RepID=W7QNG6_9ALTE|nr:DUF1080 domain-containing protein [Catenovulum agarivorans]EWH10497.1 secreted glycosyl hydrolase [Catenovulum agarivorans DS-2]